MAHLRVPSLQHLSRNWHNDPTRVKRALVRLVRNPPTFSYDPLYGAVRDMLVFGHPYEEIVEGVRRGIKRPTIRDNLLSILPLIRDHFAGVRPSFVESVDWRYYSVGRGLMVPFQPPLIYGVGGRVHFPWFSFWRTNPIEGERLSLFVSVVDDVLLQDPDLESAKFEILDFSAPERNGPRTLKVLDGRDVVRLSAERRTEMLETFAEGYFLAKKELAESSYRESEQPQRPEANNGNQPGLFDPES